MKPEIVERLDALNRLQQDGRPRSALETLCIERQVADLKTGHERGLIWDQDEANRIIELAKLLRHWKAPFTNRPFIPEPWQAELIFMPLFGWYLGKTRAEGGVRRFRTAYCETPRKQGKTTTAAPIAIQGLIADQESGGEVYCAAVKRDQARIVFDDSKNMLRGSPLLMKQVEIWKHSITCPRLNSSFKPLSSDTKGLDGLNVSRAIVDEIHKHQTRDVWDLIKTATGTRSMPLLFGITTAGHDRSSICWELHEDVRRILEGHDCDDTLFGFIACADDKDDPFDPETWKKANPNFGITIKPEYLATEAKQAKENPAKENTFRNLHLCQWTQQAIRAIPMHVWDECKGEVVAEKLYGQKCWAGIDLSSTRDVTAMALCFPQPGGTYKFLPYFWCPEDAKDDRTGQDTRQVRNWAEKGLIRTLPGNVIGYEDLADDVMHILSDFNVQEFGFDPWGPAPAFVQMLQSRGFPFPRLTEFRQGMASMASPTKVFCEELLFQRKIEHGGNPVLRWMASNMATKMDPAGNIKPDKEKSADKIDGIVACIMGLGLATRGRVNGPSVYSRRGILTVGN